MLNAIAIFIGGGLGAVTRYLTNLALREYSFNIPMSTFMVNIIGSLILGFAIALFWQKAELHGSIKLAITVGFCGGLTTFSTFSWETFDLLKRGDFLLAGIYVTASVITCVVAVAIGAYLTKYIG